MADAANQSGPRTNVVVKRNVVANYIGYAIRAAASVIFIPIYIRYLGPDAFGLIAIFAMLQVWLTTIDVGMKPALSREMARFSAGALSGLGIRDLLRSVEIVTAAIGVMTTAIIYAASGWLAVNWVNSSVLPDAVVTQTFVIMGGVAALRFVETLYTSSLSGLQMQVAENVLSSTSVLLRNVGAIGVIALVSPTIQAYFVWQGVASVLSISALAIAVYAKLPNGERGARFSWSALLSVWRFAAGALAITILSMVLTQADKVVLSRVLSLESFGYYALAGVVANLLYASASPISAAFYPRLTQLVATDDQIELSRVYHQAAQFVSVLVGSVAMTLAAFATPVILIWSQDQVLTSQVAPIAAVLALGMMLHCLMWMPYYLQLAHGWVSLSIWSNIIALAAFWPALLVVAPRYGGLATAWLWVAVNAGFVLGGSWFMHRRLLRNELWRWATSDVLIPVVTAGVIAFGGRALMPREMDLFTQALWIVAVGTLSLAASGATVPEARGEMMRAYRAVKARAHQA